MDETQMTKRILRAKLNFLIAVTLLCLTAQFAPAQETKPFSINESPLPAPTAPVNDFAGVLDEATKARLNQRLIQLRDGTNPRIEIAVAVVKTTGERPIYDYTLAVARGWKIGSKEDDNPSALLLVAIDDRKYFTQISKDLEDELPDGLAGQLQRQHLVPAFKQGDYGKGISDTIEAYIRAIEEKGNGINPTSAEKKQPQQRRGTGGLGGICNFVTCLIILFVLMIIIFSRGGGGRGGSGRSGRGGGGGFGSALPWIILGSGLGGGGGSSSSSGWGGSSSGGGGDSWGGFGGGGDFGGGGAGGDW